MESCEVMISISTHEVEFIFEYIFRIYDGVVLEIYLDHKFQWPQECLNCESLAYGAVT